MVLYHYLKDPDGNQSVNAITFEKYFQWFKLIDGLLFYSKTVNSRGKLQVFMPANLCKAILKSFMITLW